MHTHTKQLINKEDVGRFALKQCFTNYLMNMESTEDISKFLCNVIKRFVNNL